MPSECPTCHAPEPHLHPQCGRTGELQPCPDPFHTQITEQNTQERIALMHRMHEALVQNEQISVYADELIQYKREVLNFARQGLIRRGWTDIPLVVLTIVKSSESKPLEGTSANLWTRECIGVRKYMLEFVRDTLTHAAEIYDESPPESTPVLQ